MVSSGSRRVIGAMSYALDVTEGEPPGHATRACKIGMRLAQAVGLDAATRSRLFYALLLKDAGCSANSAKMAALFGADDHVAKRSSKRVDWSGRLPALAWSVRTVAPGGSARARLDRLLAIKAEGEVTRALMQARCDRGAEIALMLGLEPETAEAIRALDEHWDGGGQPRGLRGEEIPLLGRILCLAQTAEIFHAAGGPRAAWRVARRRRGHWFDPALVDAFGTLRADTAFWDSLRDDEIASWEPEDRLLTADDARLDQIALAFAGVVDAKSPWTYRHSDRACLIATGLASALGADAGPAARSAPYGAAARHRQARDLEPDPRQARPAHRRRVRPGQGAPAGQRADHRAGPRLRAPRPGRRGPPRAPRRQRLPPRAVRGRADDADARARGRRRLRGAHVRAPVPPGAVLGDGPRHHPRRRPGTIRPRGLRDARAAARR